MNLKGLLALLCGFFLVLFFSCTKINEATDLGDDLIPAVDNVNTFDTTLEVTSSYFPYDDSSKHLINENMALGRINDPLFGTTTADMYFNLSSGSAAGSTPFINKDSVVAIDSVILSLSYQGAYGDTSLTSSTTVQVSEINDPSFYDTILYRFDHPGFISGGSIGSKTFSVPQLRDSTRFSFSGKRADTLKSVNVLRIPLSIALGDRLKNFSNAAGQPYASDSLFRAAFRGLAVKVVNASGNGSLSYFNLSDLTNTRLQVYFRYNSNKDTAVASFVHAAYSQANAIRRAVNGAYAAGLGAATPQSLYIQSSPKGSYAGLTIPSLSTFPNKVIHRAELIVTRIPDPLNTIFTVPNRLYLDHKGANNSKDSAYFFDNDLVTAVDGSLNYSSFGGFLKTDNTYRFNLTRYVQGIVTRHERNDSLRLFAPLRSNVYSKNIGQVISLPTLTNIAAGRVVIAGGANANANTRMRMRIIYSNL